MAVELRKELPVKLIKSPLLKLAQTQPCEEKRKAQQCSVNQPRRHVRKLGRQGQAKSLARINERIDQHGVLEPGNDVQRRPRIISTTKKDHGCKQHSKDEANLLWGRDCAHEHTKAANNQLLRRATM